MSENKDDKIEDVLVDSELAKKLVPNKFKFTSQQGRIRISFQISKRYFWRYAF